MAANRKLTPLLAGRTVQSVEQIENLLTIVFSDGSTMQVKTSGPAAALDFQGQRVRKVRQAGALMHMDFADKTSVALPLAGATASVLLRDGNGVFEYAD